MIGDYLHLNDTFKYGMRLIVDEHKLGNIEMTIPNNSILKGGEVK